MPLLPERRRRASAGFSLIELLIAVAIIMIIIGVSVPMLRKTRQNALETAAAENLENLKTQLLVYSTRYSNIGFPPSLAALGPPPAGGQEGPNAAGLVDETMAQAATKAKQGYIYTYTPASGTPSYGFSITATPQAGAATRYFYMDQDGTIHFNDGAPATATSPTIQ